MRAFEDGRYVFVHAHQSLNDGEHQWVTTDLFDTDEDDKIIEHWSNAETIPPTKNGPTPASSKKGSDPFWGEV